MGVIDKLLQMDAGKVQALPTKEVEIERLTKLAGEPVKFVCRAVDGEKYADNQRMAVSLSKKGGIKEFDSYELQVQTVLSGVADPSLKSQELLQHFNAATPKELVGKMLLPGEIAELYNVINELSGYDREEDDEEVKKE